MLHFPPARPASRWALFPFICQAADPKGLIRLPAPGEARAAEHVSEDIFRRVVHGTADEAVLSALFGLDHTRSDATEELRSELSSLRAKQLHGAASTGEKRRLAELQRVLPLTPAGAVESALEDVKALLGTKPRAKSPRRAR